MNLQTFMMQEKLGEKYYEDCIYVDEDDVYNFTERDKRCLIIMLIR